MDWNRIHKKLSKKSGSGSIRFFRIRATLAAEFPKKVKDLWKNLVNVIFSDNKVMVKSART